MKKTFRVILMSSLSYHERKGYPTVTDDVPFLQKAFSVETLTRLVREVLASAPLRSPTRTPPPNRSPHKRFGGMTNLALHERRFMRKSSKSACTAEAFMDNAG